MLCPSLTLTPVCLFSLSCVFFVSLLDAMGANPLLLQLQRKNLLQAGALEQTMALGTDDVRRGMCHACHQQSLCACSDAA